MLLLLLLSSLSLLLPIPLVWKDAGPNATVVVYTKNLSMRDLVDMSEESDVDGFEDDESMESEDLQSDVMYCLANWFIHKDSLSIVEVVSEMDEAGWDMEELKTFFRSQEFRSKYKVVGGLRDGKIMQIDHT